MIAMRPILEQDVLDLLNDGRFDGELNDKMEAYKQDKLEEQEKARILKESQVKGSDFYFELQNQQERYDRRCV